MRGRDDLVVITNTMIERPSGSDIRALKLCRYFGNFFNIKVILSKDAYSYFIDDKIKVYQYKVTKQFSKRWGYFLGVIILYLIRLGQSLLFLPKLKSNLIFYSTTDLLVDVIPGFVGKILNRNSSSVQIIHHLIPSRERRGKSLRNNLSFLSQNMSLCLIKKYSDLVVVMNSQIKSELEKKGFRNKIENVGNGIDVEEIRSIRANVAPEKRFEGIYVGRVNYTKGAIDLIEIWKEVVVKRQNAKLVIVGNVQTDVYQKMTILIKRYHLSKNICFKGYISRFEMVTLLKSSLLFLYPSHEEGWGISIAEAMACKLPVVAYDLPVYPEIFPKGMIRYKIGAIKEMSQGILVLLADKVLYSKFSLEAYKVATAYSWDRVAKKEIALIKSIL